MLVFMHVILYACTHVLIDAHPSVCRAVPCSRTKTVTSALAETYLRDDVPCGSDLCTAGCCATASRLSAGAAFYVLPDADVLTQYIEIFELQGIENCVVLGSIVKQVGGAVRVVFQVSGAASTAHSAVCTRRRAPWWTSFALSTNCSLARSGLRY